MVKGRLWLEKVYEISSGKNKAMKKVCPDEEEWKIFNKNHWSEDDPENNWNFIIAIKNYFY